MTLKKVGVKKAGETTIREVEVNESTNTSDVLRLVDCPTDGTFFLSTAVGQPPLGMTEPVFDRVPDGGKLYVIPKADAGA